MKNTGIVYHSTERTPTVLAELAGLLPPLSGAVSYTHLTLPTTERV